MLWGFLHKVYTSALFQDVINLLFPRRCLLCGKGKSDVCLTCRQSLLYAEEREELAHKNIYSVLSYKDEKVRQIMWLLKYRNVRSLSSFCAEVLYEQLLEEISDRALFSNFTKPLLIPIPLSKKRRRFRGFNQSEDIARELALRIPECELLSHVLVKTKETPAQMSIHSKTKRRRNVAGCFTVYDPGAVRGRNIILIDDITTTGATLSEAHKVLRQAGAREVLAYTVAH